MNEKLISCLEDILDLFQTLGLRYEKSMDKHPHDHSKACVKLFQLQKKVNQLRTLL